MPMAMAVSSRRYFPKVPDTFLVITQRWSMGLLGSRMGNPQSTRNRNTDKSNRNPMPVFRATSDKKVLRLITP